jgi:kinesin family protein 11
LLQASAGRSLSLLNNAPQVVTRNDYQREVAITQSIDGKQFDQVFSFDKVCCPLPAHF